MATVKAIVGTRTALTTSALNSLASATYVSAGTIDLTTPDPLDLLIEVNATPGTVSGNRQVVVFARVSLDGTNFSTGPVSGTTTTDEPNLRFLGTVPCNTNSTLQRNVLSVMSSLGYVPAHLEIVIKNDTGAALAASGHAVHYSTVIGDVT
jgi:hypothetical protein